MPPRLDQLRAKAEECRAFAATVKDHGVRLQMLEIATQYEYLANLDEQLDDRGIGVPSLPNPDTEG